MCQVGVGQLEEVFLLVLWVAALEYIYVAEDLGLHGAHCANLSFWGAKLKKRKARQKQEATLPNNY